MLVGCPAPALAQEDKGPAKKDEKKLNEALREEILRMREEDQEHRKKLNDWVAVNGSTNLKDPKKVAELQAINKQLQSIDRKNTERLKVIVQKHGWPGKSLVDVDGASAAWLMVQHADHDRPFQRRCLQLMEAAAKQGEVSKTDVGYLVDRLLIADGKKQRYGTQFKLEKNDWVPHPIEDAANVDKRRADLDMPPLAEYKKMILEQYMEKGKEAKK